MREPKPFLKQRLLPQPKYTIMELRDQSRTIIESGRASGLLINIQKLEIGNATIESLIDIIKMWQEHNFPVWVWSNSYSFFTYFLASVADKIFLTTGGILNTT